MPRLLDRQLRLGRRHWTTVGTVLRWTAYWIAILACVALTVMAYESSPA